MDRIVDWPKVRHHQWMKESARLRRVANIWLSVAVISTLLLTALLLVRV